MRQLPPAAAAVLALTGILWSCGTSSDPGSSPSPSTPNSAAAPGAPPAFTLLGVVSQAGAAVPVQGASIDLVDGVNAGRSTTTDGNGYYSLGGLLGGSFTLQARKNGYVGADKAVTLASDTRLDFTMSSVAPPSPPPQAVPQCNANLWAHVYDSGRLHVVRACQTVTGTITDQHTNEDGDIDVRLAVDAPYTNLLNAGNTSNLSGHLQTEAICQTAIQDASAARACQGFRGSVGVPRNGTHVQVTGTYVLDTIHGWMEIHPISDLRMIP